MNNNRLIPTLGVALALCLLPLSAFAVPITGTLDLSGGAYLNSASLGTATGVTTFGDVVVSDVTTGSSLDSYINIGDAVVTNAPWTFTSGISSLWSVGGFTFDLVTSAVEVQTPTLLYVHGFGTITGNGFDPTSGEFFMTSQGHGDGFKFSFSNTTESSGRSVPDGGNTLLLLGGGMAALGVMSSRKFSVSQKMRDLLRLNPVGCLMP